MNNDENYDENENFSYFSDFMILKNIFESDQNIYDEAEILKTIMINE